MTDAAVRSPTGTEPRQRRDRPASSAGRDGALIGALKTRDNITNWFHLARVWLIIGATVAATIYATAAIAAAGLGWGWSVPVVIAAILVIGASQHQLGGAIHEGAHYMLFENRMLNEIASDWLCAYPIHTSTYHYRLNHMAHHQFINDKDRDPDYAQLHDSGHWLDFPISHMDFLIAIGKQLWLPNLMRYTAVRARYSALGTVYTPYNDPARVGSPWPIRLGVIYTAGLPFVLMGLCWLGDWRLVAGVLAAAWAALFVYYLRIPADWFAQTRLEPVISHRGTAIGRLNFVTALYATLSAAQLAGAGPAWIWYMLLWLVPLFTAFPLFMILRQWVQHGNADRGRYTNSRVFLVGPVVRYAVFPWGQEYHLPHHMFASVPHYRLKDLHELLLKDPEYREKAVVVEGYFGPDDAATGRPTAVSVLGPAHAPSALERAHVDNDVLERAEIRGREAVAREAELSERGLQAARGRDRVIRAVMARPSTRMRPLRAPVLWRRASPALLAASARSKRTDHLANAARRTSPDRALAARVRSLSRRLRHAWTRGRDGRAW